jgi:hypothetical protein
VNMVMNHVNSIKSKEFLDPGSDYVLLMKDSTLCNWLV